MKAKKILFFFVLVTLVTLSGWAFGNSEQSRSSAPVFELNSPVTIVMWHTLAGHQLAAFQRIVDDFNAQNPMVTVTLQSQPGQNFSTNLLQRVRQGQGPDMVSIFADDASNYIAEGRLIDFAPFVNHRSVGMPNLRSSIPASSYADITQWGGGTIYMFPVIATGPVLFYNKTLFDNLQLSPPRTWSELEAASRIIVRETGRPAFGVDSLQDLFNSLIMQGGSPHTNVRTRTVTFNTPVTLEKVTWFANLVQERVFRLAGSDVRFSNVFGSEGVAAYIGSSASIGFIREATGNRFEIGAAPIPVEGPVQWVPTFNMAYAGFKSTPEREFAVYLFYKYLMQPEIAARWAMDYDAIPIPIEAFNSPAYQAFANESIVLRALVEQSGRIGYVPTTVGSSTVRDSILTLMEAAALGTKTPAQAIADAVDTSNRTLQAYR
ncbi:MAG: extracellular solute-binding protein [Treponema sp.]|nr:extracellular solute-binding protein [Treponema sp.]